jgi:hypothetical protein
LEEMLVVFSLSRCPFSIWSRVLKIPRSVCVEEIDGLFCTCGVCVRCCKGCVRSKAAGGGRHQSI